MIDALVRTIGHRIKYGAKTRSTLYYSGSSIVCQGLRFLGILISTRAMAPDQFGQYATAMMLVGLCGLAKEFGQNPAFLSCTRTYPGYARFHFLVSMALSFIVVILVVSAVTLLPALSNQRSAVPLLCLMVLIEGATMTPLVIAQKRFEFRRMAIIEIAATATWLLCVGSGSKWYPVAMTLIFARLMESLVRAISLLGWFHRDVIQGDITREITRYYGRFAYLLAPQGWIENLLGNLDVLLLNFFSTQTDLGVYDRTNQLVRIPLSTSINLVDRVAAAAYSRDQESTSLLQRSILQFAALVLLGTLAGLVAVQLFVWLFAGPLLGASWKNAVSSLWLWAIPYCVFRPLVWNFNLVFLATSRPGHLLVTLVGILLILSIVGLILTPSLGSRGVFVAFGVGYFITLAAQTLWFIKSIRQSRQQ
jgi:polysaccharide transporter, PST family